MVRLAAMGDNVVDCYVSKDTMFPGGNCLNVSVFLSRFGAQSAYVGAIGKDPAGELLTRCLEHEEVDISHLRRLDDGATAYCIIGHHGTDRVFVRVDLGISMFDPSPDDFTFLVGFDGVHIGQSSGLDGYVAQAASNTRVSYDFSTRRDAGHRRTIAPHCFLASVSGGDLSRGEGLEIMRELTEAGAKWVLMTRGYDGAMLLGNGRLFEVQAAPTELVDTLGAGDTFIARTLYGLVTGERPAELLKAASKAAADTCRYFGAVGYPTRISLQGDVPEPAGVAGQS